jgi:prolyl oligopeptidase
MSLNYPYARIEEVTDCLAGIRFQDPYRWLESETQETLAWQREQANLVSNSLKGLPTSSMRDLVVELTAERYVELPRYAGGLWFRIESDHTPARAVVSAEAFGNGRVLFDLGSENCVGTATLSWLSPSPNARILAIGLCLDGSENNHVRLIDVQTGRFLSTAPSQTLMDNWTGGVHWLPDSSGFFFSALVGTTSEFRQDVYLYQLQPEPVSVLMGVNWTEEHDYRMVVVSQDGRYAIAIERLQAPIPVAIAALCEFPLRWRPFVRSTQHSVAGHVVAGRYVAVTTEGAPRGRLVEIKIDEQNPDDPRTWRELVLESEAILRTITLVDEWLYLTEFVDTYAQVRIVDRNGNRVGEVPLPGFGAVASELPFPMMNLIPRGSPCRFVFGFSTPTESPGVFVHSPGEPKVTPLRSARVTLRDAVVEDHWAASSDGAKVLYQLVRRKDVAYDTPRPTLIYAYGGYNYPLTPHFPGPMAAIIRMGGNLVLAHIRGGGELGLDWWQSGRMARKQNSYEDLYAVAEHLIARGTCTPATLALTGSSNGGLMCGVALTQRPDLWAAVVPRVPVLDLVGACRDAYGRQAIMEELADVDDAAEVFRLASYSPYHRIQDNVRYPAVLLQAGATDPRCPAWHARKFAARLQHANAGETLILLHVWENAGHGWATDHEIALAQNTEWLSFICSRLGLSWEPRALESSI